MDVRLHARRRPYRCRDNEDGYYGKAGFLRRIRNTYGRHKRFIMKIEKPTPSIKQQGLLCLPLAARLSKVAMETDTAKRNEPALVRWRHFKSNQRKENERHYDSWISKRKWGKLLFGGNVKQIVVRIRVGASVVIDGNTSSSQLSELVTSRSMDSTRLFSGACLLCRKGKSIHVSAEAQARTILFSFFILTFQTIFNKTRWIVEERAEERKRERERRERGKKR